MKMIKILIRTVLGISLFSSMASAAELLDVSVLSSLQKESGVRLKLQAHAYPDSYFVVEISKNDPEALKKMGYVTSKLTQKEKFKLHLEIPSFSAYPSGSFYPSTSVQFYTDADREPNSLKTPEKKTNKHK